MLAIFNFLNFIKIKDVPSNFGLSGFNFLKDIWNEKELLQKKVSRNLEARIKPEFFHCSVCLLGLGSDSLLLVLSSDVLMPEKKASSLDGWFRIL